MMQGLLWETSLLDADEGIRFRGYSIPELQASRPVLAHIAASLSCFFTPAAAPGMQAKLPAVKEQPLPEGLLWLLLTGDIPTKAQAASVTEDLRVRSQASCRGQRVPYAIPIKYC
jgi:citrate synthase